MSFFLLLEKDVDLLQQHWKYFYCTLLWFNCTVYSQFSANYVVLGCLMIQPDLLPPPFWLCALSPGADSPGPVCGSGTPSASQIASQRCLSHIQMSAIHWLIKRPGVKCQVMLFKLIAFSVSQELNLYC